MIKKFLCLFILLLVCGGVNVPSWAAVADQAQIYESAKNGDMKKLSGVDDIDVTDKDGNTALCQAIINGDVDGYRALRASGANTYHDCVKKIDSETYKNFMARVMHRPGWMVGRLALTALGAGLVGGATVAAFGGDVTEVSNVPPTCAYNTTVCAGGYEETGNTCKSGENLYKECRKIECGANSVWNPTGCLCNAGYESWTAGAGCSLTVLNCVNGTQNGTACVCDTGWTGTLCDVPQACAGYPYETCPVGYAALDSESCLSGNVRKYKCTQCDAGYGKDSTGVCVPKLTDPKIGRNITNNDYADVIGILENVAEGASPDGFPANNGLVNLTNNSDGDVFGAQNNIGEFNNASNTSGAAAVDALITINNNGDGNVYGVSGKYGGANAYTDTVGGTPSVATGVITVTNNGAGNSYGMHSTNGHVQNAYAWVSDGTISNNSVARSDATINMTNNGTGTAFGLFGTLAYNAVARGATDLDVPTANGSVNITNNGTGDAYGIYGSEIAYNGYFMDSKNDFAGYNTVNGNVKIINNNSGDVFGIYGVKEAYNTVVATGDSNVVLVNRDAGLAVGLRGADEVQNNGNITIHNLGDGTAIGMYGVGGNVVNSGDITITRASYDGFYAPTETGGLAIGIYGANGASITNSGTISIDGADMAYGIWAADNTVAIFNTGTININGVTCTGVACQPAGLAGNAQAIVLNGGTLFNGGVLSSDNLNLDAFGGLNIATANAQYVASGELSGTLMMASSIVARGNSTRYTTTGTVSAADTSGLKLLSQSALFDAALAENGTDVNLTMKSFNDVVENQSLANFLTANYAANNNAALFTNLKSYQSLDAMNDSLDVFMGRDMFSRFAFEDFTMMRELNFDSNNKLFGDDAENLSVSGNVASLAFSGNSSYALNRAKIGNYSVGFSMAFSDITSNDDNSQNARNDRLYNISTPIGYQMNGFKFITAPRVGYAYGTYSRAGLFGESYEGTIEKQMFALMNEARYPISFGNWTFAPSAEANVVAYEISGHEQLAEFALNVPRQNTYSVEAGIGFHANNETQIGENGRLRFNGGVALYHEFADPYQITLAMNGMDGTFILRDDGRATNRAMVYSGMEFSQDNLSFNASMASYMDYEFNTKFSMGVKYKF